MNKLPKISKPEGAAKTILKRLYKNSPHSDVVTVEDIYRNANRNLQDEVGNKAWLANQLTVLRSYNFITSIKETTGYKKLISIRLTSEGRKALGRETGNNDEPSINHINDSLSLESVVSMIKTFKNQNPSVEVEFNIKVREEASQPQ